jgi:hypothetical protein
MHRRRGRSPTLLAVELEMNPTDVYRHAIKRTLAGAAGAGAALSF